MIGAPHNVLVEEASTIKLLMRMAESKGAMEFHPDLVHYYASEHGGLNEYSNRVWKRREGQNLVNHSGGGELRVDARDHGGEGDRGVFKLSSI